MLIRNAQIWGHGLGDLRIADGRIAAILPPSGSSPEAGTGVIDACGAALLPGLHDHHIHVAGLAVRSQSVWCGPPAIASAQALAAALAALTGEDWVRGIGYHESVMGLPDAAELDRMMPDRPLRIQHRSGRLWLLNSMALARLLEGTTPPPGMEMIGGRPTGRLFDEDQWLQQAMASSPPDLESTGERLARWGLTGLTDMSPRNDPAIAAHFAAQHECGKLPQNLVLAGALSLAGAKRRGWSLGPAKLHLHEAALPDFDATVAFISAAHRQERPIAVHCVSEVELVFALAALEQAGPCPGDRIEHASVASPALVGRMAEGRLAVCAQPHFVVERGDAYRRDVEERHQGDLYRLASLAAAGIALAGGSDAPFGDADPWHAMRAAVQRQTASGQPFGADEALSPEAALSLYLADPADLSRQRALVVGSRADLVLLDRPWEDARLRLDAGDVRMTVIGGKIVHQCVDQPPA